MAREALDEASDRTKLDNLPNIELEDIMLVGQRDREAFLDPYHRSVQQALELFKVHELAYNQLDFELLTMTIMAENEVSERHKDQLYKVILRRVKDYHDDLALFEQIMDATINRKDFATLFNVKKFEVDAMRSIMKGKTT